MFISNQQYTTLEAACGVQLVFNAISPKPKKIGNVTGASRNVGVSDITVSNLSDEVLDSIRNNTFINQKIRVTQADDIKIIDASGIPDSFLGNFSVVSATSSNITYNQNLPFTQPLPRPIFGDLYLQENIAPAENYQIDFIIESKAPSTSEVILRPESYLVSGYDEFTPVVIMEAISRYSKSIKILVKMQVKNAANGNVLKTEYKEIIVSDSSDKPCEIIYPQPIQTSYIYLNKQNQWTYYHEGFLLAKFLPTPAYNNAIVKLVRKNTNLLPTRSVANRLRIIADPLKLIEKKTTIDKIRNSILNIYDTILNSVAIQNLENRSYDIIIKDILLKPEDLNNIVVDIVDIRPPNNTGTEIKFSDVAVAVNYDQDMDTIPKVSILKWDKYYIGELHYNAKIYDQDTILVDIHGDNSIVLPGIISDVSNGINKLNDPAPAIN